jgi:hypothetical protein
VGAMLGYDQDSEIKVLEFNLQISVIQKHNQFYLDLIPL